ncbi:MAG: hypothetical protein ACJ780_14185 [Solirubrobacteraceae bacterium]
MRTRVRHRRAPRHTAPRTARLVAPVLAPVAPAHRVVRRAPAHQDGLTLALGAVLLLVLVGISLGLLRLVRRLHDEVTMGTPA